jgi:hypothetical protein
VVFATVHVAGSTDDFVANNEARADEALRRMRANVDWIRSTFEAAKTTNAPAVVIAMHAAIFNENYRGGSFNQRVRGGYGGTYYWVALAIRDFATAFGKPVLFVHGDYHEFIVDNPFRVGESEVKPPEYDNITRVQVFGAPELRAVQINVDTDTPWVFGFTPLYAR